MIGFFPGPGSSLGPERIQHLVQRLTIPSLQLNITSSQSEASGVTISALLWSLVTLRSAGVEAFPPPPDFIFDRLDDGPDVLPSLHAGYSRVPDVGDSWNSAILSGFQALGPIQSLLFDFGQSVTRISGGSDLPSLQMVLPMLVMENHDISLNFSRLWAGRIDINKTFILFLYEPGIPIARGPFPEINHSPAGSEYICTAYCRL